MSIRKKLNETAGKIPYVGKALAKEIGLKEIGIMGIGAYMALVNAIPAKAGPRVYVEDMWGENETTQTMTLDTKIFGTIEGKLDYFLRNRTPIDMNDNNTVGDSMTFVDLNYEFLKGLDAVLAAKLTTGSSAESRLGLQYMWTKDGLFFYTLATRKLNEDPNTEWKFDVGYSGPISGNWGWRTNWEGLFTFPDGQTTTNISRIRLGATYRMPNSKTILSFGPALDINNIQNGENAATHPRTVMPGAYMSISFK